MSEFINPFVLKAEEYKRDIDVVKHYRDQVIHHLMLTEGIDQQKAADFVDIHIMTRMVDPKAKLLERQENGDRKKVVVPFTKFLNRVIKEEQILVPTFTSYRNQKQKPSIVAGIMEFLVKRRSAAKKEMFKAKQAGNKLVEQNKEGEQGALKRNANALSGAQGSSTNVFSNKSAHSTLTSNCRTTSGYGNINNEKLISGNRIYWHYEIVLANINAILVKTNLTEVERIIEKYNLVYPTKTDVMDCILYSLKLYTLSTFGHDKIIELVDKLSPVQRAAFVYIGDLYHLRKHNSDFMRDFVTRMIHRIEDKPKNPEWIEGNHNEAQRVLAKLINFVHFSKPEVIKMSLDDFKKEGRCEYDYFLATLENLYLTCVDYSDFIKVFLVSDNMPNSVAQLPNAPRRNVLASDTDSTIFTLQEWVKWYCGKIIFGDVPNRVSDLMVFLASQTTTHLLAKMSANFGVIPERIFQIAMKNEFKFDIFSPTPEAKHYYAGISSQEGIIMKDLKMEIKGVGLINSNIPSEIMDGARNLMTRIVNTVYRNEKISALKVLNDLADIEYKILMTVMGGKNNFFRRAVSKDAGTYKNGELNTAVIQCEMWNEVFAPKYGYESKAPFDVVKALVTLETRTEVNTWLEKLKHKGHHDIVDRMSAWMAKRGRKHLGRNFWVPLAATENKGIPVEVIYAINIRSLIWDLVSPYYLIMKTLGIYMDNGNISRLAMDSYGTFDRDTINHILN